MFRSGPSYIQPLINRASCRLSCCPSSDPSWALTHLIEACFAVEAAGWASADRMSDSAEAALAGSEAADSEADSSAAPAAA
jgi:hypothetical protein